MPPALLLCLVVATGVDGTEDPVLLPDASPAPLPLSAETVAAPEAASPPAAPAGGGDATADDPPPSPLPPVESSGRRVLASLSAGLTTLAALGLCGCVLSAPLALTTVTWVPALLASTVVAGLAGWVVGSVVGKRRVPLWGALLLAGPPLLLGMAVQVVPAALLNLGLLFAYTEPTATGRHFSNHTLQRGLRKGETHVLVALALFGLLTTVGTGMALGSTAVAWWLVATGRPRTDGEPALSWDLLDVPEPST